MSQSNNPPFTNTATGCIYLDDKTPCGPDYYGYPIKTGILPGFSDYPSLVEVLSTATTPAGIANTFSCAINAIEQQVNDLRYQTSFICAKVSCG
jgi:hypothetical protein